MWDKDAVLLEIDEGNTSFYAASIYLDYNKPIENNIKTLEKILKFAKGANIIIEMDSNSLSTTWHELTTNSGGKLWEEFFASNQLHIINEGGTIQRFKEAEDQAI